MRSSCTQASLNEGADIHKWHFHHANREQNLSPRLQTLTPFAGGESDVGSKATAAPCAIRALVPPPASVPWDCRPGPYPYFWYFIVDMYCIINIILIIQYYNINYAALL